MIKLLNGFVLMHTTTRTKWHRRVAKSIQNSKNKKKHEAMKGEDPLHVERSWHVEKQRKKFSADLIIIKCFERLKS